MSLNIENIVNDLRELKKQSPKLFNEAILKATDLFNETETETDNVSESDGDEKAINTPDSQNDTVTYAEDPNHDIQDDNQDDDEHEDDYDEDEYWDDCDDDDDEEPTYGVSCVITSNQYILVVNLDDDSDIYTFDVDMIPAFIVDKLRDIRDGSIDSITESTYNIIKNTYVPVLCMVLSKLFEEHGFNVEVINGRLHIVGSDGDKIKVNDSAIRAMSKKIHENDIDAVKRIINFYLKLNKNSSFRVIDRLYDFISCNSIDIDSAGNVICYKAVLNNYYDCHTGCTYLNTVGSTIEMNRKEVDDNDLHTCSNGLHVCSINYLKGFYWTNDKIMVKVLIEPKDFVSIPVDYNDSKARVCKYKVIGEYNSDEVAEMLDVTVKDTNEENDMDYFYTSL